jgi:predicted RNA-binding Zn ribbon-like protein
MPLRLDNNLLDELGLTTLPETDKPQMLNHIRETLEMRVGTRLAEQMSDAQLDEFERFVQAQDDQGALNWLETNFPNYKDVVNEEFEKLKVEIKQSAPQILANS